MAGRVLTIVLDGHEPTAADSMIERGELPAMAALGERSRRWPLDHGPAKRSGLAGEHLATGLDPAKAGRWSAVHFDKDSYAIQQRPTGLPPFTAALSVKSTVFDAPYFDLSQAGDTEGLVAWGAHDPGVPPLSRPSSLMEEVGERFGPYPAKRWIYGLAWPSAEKCREMGRRLVDAVDRRAAIAHWLLAERLPDWRFGLVVVSELHSANEGLWHGIDPGHPLYHHPSRPAAGEGLMNVLRATDLLIGRLAEAFPDAVLALTTPHGMGRNNSDPASMLLLAEAMYRYSLGRPAWKPRPGWQVGEEPPQLQPDESWEQAMASCLRLRPRLWRRVFPNRLPARAGTPGRLTMSWMPATLYRPAWPDMQAFALPSFYDGQIRLNLKRRESRGLIDPVDYGRRCDEIEDFLRECRDPRTGDPVVDDVIRTAGDPLDRPPSACDIVVTWRGTPLAISHPRIGTVGPAPFRRAGGHTGGDGFLWLAGRGIAAGTGARASTFDVVPTLMALLDHRPSPAISGQTLLDVAALA